ncbi:MAG: O-antigen ligase family protein [Oligoflexales bacterium]
MHFLRALFVMHIVAGAILLSAAFVLNNFYSIVSHEPMSNIAVFLLSLTLAWKEPRFGFAFVVFYLPFGEGFCEYVQKTLNIGNFFYRLSVFDASLGFMVGQFLWFYRKGKLKFVLDQTPPVIYFLSIAVQLVLVASVSLAIARNLYQAGSSFSLVGLKFNFINMRGIGYRDDFYPLNELIIYCAANFLLLSSFWAFRIGRVSFASLENVLYAAGGFAFAFMLWQVFKSEGNAIRGFKSLFPDIHSCAGFGLMLFIGGMFSWHKKLWRKQVIGLVVSIASLCLIVLSDSRASIVIAGVSLLVYGIIAIRLGFLSIRRLPLFLLFLVIACFLIFAWKPNVVDRILSLKHVSTWEDVDTIMSHRLDVYYSVLRMIMDYPILGLGKGLLFRSSGFPEFARSRYFESVGGENAHNFFLQIMVETGVVGFLVLVLLPLVFLANRATMKNCAAFLLLGLVLGNIFAHSLLLPEFLLLASVLLGGIYHERFRHSEKIIFRPKMAILLLSLLTLGVGGSSVFAYFSNRELLPFKTSLVCHRLYNFEENYVSALSFGGVDVARKDAILKIRPLHPDLQKDPLYIELMIFDRHQILKHNTYKLRQADPLILNISNLLASDRIGYWIRSSRCYTPLNFGKGFDRRRLALEMKWGS